MLIGGLQKFTLIDYPDKTACIVFLSGCNFRCPWCYSPELVLPEKIEKHPKIKEEEIFSFLSERKDKLDGVVLCGGEPTIHREIIDFSRKIKEMGFLLKLDTNGSNPEMIKRLMEKELIDYIAMDVKLPFSRYQEISSIDFEKIKESIRIIKESSVDYEFRTTVVPGIHTENDIAEIARSIEGAKKYFLQNFFPDKTLDSSFLRKKPFSKEELDKLKEKAAPFVKMCQVR